MTKAVIALKMALLQEDAAILLLQHFCSNEVIKIFFEIKCLLPFAATSWKSRILIQIKIMIRYPQLVSTIITFFWRFCFLQEKLRFLATCCSISGWSILMQLCKREMIHSLMSRPWFHIFSGHILAFLAENSAFRQWYSDLQQLAAALRVVASWSNFNRR